MSLKDIPKRMFWAKQSEQIYRESFGCPSGAEYFCAGLVDEREGLPEWSHFLLTTFQSTDKTILSSSLGLHDRAFDDIETDPVPENREYGIWSVTYRIEADTEEWEPGKGFWINEEVEIDRPTVTVTDPCSFEQAVLCRTLDDLVWAMVTKNPNRGFWEKKIRPGQSFCERPEHFSW